MNLRDYPGSTPYSTDELAALSSDDVTQQTAATKAHGDEVAAFLEYFIKKHGIPKIADADGSRTGGLALVTWSMSNILAFSFLGNVRSLSPETSSFLEQYVRAVVLYGKTPLLRFCAARCLTPPRHTPDPAISSLGLPPAGGVYSPLRDTSLSLDERGALFVPWVSNYFETIPDLATVTPTMLAARPTTAKTPTVARIPPTELEALLDRGALVRSSSALFRVAREVLHANFRRALLDTDGVWPRVKVLLVWCDESMHDCVWAARTIVALTQAPREDGDSGIRREFEVEKLAGANHFVSPVAALCRATVLRHGNSRTGIRLRPSFGYWCPRCRRASNGVFMDSFRTRHTCISNLHPNTDMQRTWTRCLFSTNSFLNFLSLGRSKPTTLHHPSGSPAEMLQM